MVVLRILGGTKQSERPLFGQREELTDRADSRTVRRELCFIPSAERLNTRRPTGKPAASSGLGAMALSHTSTRAFTWGSPRGQRRSTGARVPLHSTGGS